MSLVNGILLNFASNTNFSHSYEPLRRDTLTYTIRYTILYDVVYLRAPEN